MHTDSLTQRSSAALPHLMSSLSELTCMICERSKRLLLCRAWWNGPNVQRQWRQSGVLLSDATEHIPFWCDVSCISGTNLLVQLQWVDLHCRKWVVSPTAFCVEFRAILEHSQISWPRTATPVGSELEVSMHRVRPCFLWLLVYVALDFAIQGHSKALVHGEGTRSWMPCLPGTCRQCASPSLFGGMPLVRAQGMMCTN